MAPGRFTIFKLRSYRDDLVARVDVRQSQQRPGFGLELHAAQHSGEDKYAGVWLRPGAGRLRLALTWKAGTSELADASELGDAQGEMRAILTGVGIQESIAIDSLVNSTLAYDAFELGFLDSRGKVSDESRLAVHRFAAHRLGDILT